MAHVDDASTPAGRPCSGLAVVVLGVSDAIERTGVFGLRGVACGASPWTVLLVEWKPLSCAFDGVGVAAGGSAAVPEKASEALSGSAGGLCRFASGSSASIGAGESSFAGWSSSSREESAGAAAFVTPPAEITACAPDISALRSSSMQGQLFLVDDRRSLRWSSSVSVGRGCIRSSCATVRASALNWMPSSEGGGIGRRHRRSLE